MALASVRGGPGEGAQGTSAVSPPPRAMKIPITFQLNNTEMQKYVIDIVNDEMDVMRVR